MHKTGPTTKQGTHTYHSYGEHEKALKRRHESYTVPRKDNDKTICKNGETTAGGGKKGI